MRMRNMGGSESHKTKNQTQKNTPDKGAFSDAIENPGLRNNTENQGICIFDTASACVDKKVMQSILDLINSTCKCKIIGPQDIGYEEAERLIQDSLGIK